MPATILTVSLPALHRRRISLRARLAATLALWQQRRALAQLDDSRLADLGLSREQALAESARPVWDAPRYWR